MFVADDVSHSLEPPAPMDFQWKHPTHLGFIFIFPPSSNLIMVLFLAAIDNPSVSYDMMSIFLGRHSNELMDEHVVIMVGIRWERK